MRVGFIGIGNMGTPMSANILKAGHQLIVYDKDPARAAQFASAHGCACAARLADLAGVDFMVTMLPTGQIVRDVYLAEGDGGLAPHLTSATTAIDMSSSEPNGTRQLGAALAKSGIVLLDAPVSGAVPRAQSATLTIMIGGDDPAAIERAKPLLSTMGNRLFETGGLGSGHAMKALNNFVAAAGYTAAAEALLVGRRFGLDPARMLEILNVSTGRNFITEVVMKEHVIDGKFATGFALGLLAKDVKIAADLANEVQQNAPLAQLIKDRWAMARDRLGAARDNSEAILAWGEPLEKTQGV
jgi:3-hydroxyisobutyrate dehydrogenase